MDHSSYLYCVEFGCSTHSKGSICKTNTWSQSGHIGDIKHEWIYNWFCFGDTGSNSAEHICVALCSAVQCNDVQYSALQCRALQCTAMHCTAMNCCNEEKKYNHTIHILHNIERDDNILPSFIVPQRLSQVPSGEYM